MLQSLKDSNRHHNVEAVIAEWQTVCLPTNVMTGAFRVSGQSAGKAGK
jgi:hypothetical protein